MDKQRVPWACRNEPNVHLVRKEGNSQHFQGAKLTVTILGNWQYYRSKILKYLRQIAVITPYAQFTFAYKAMDEKNSIHVNFLRRTDRMPRVPQVGTFSIGSHFKPSYSLIFVASGRKACDYPGLSAFESLPDQAQRNQRPIFWFVRHQAFLEL